MRRHFMRRVIVFAAIAIALFLAAVSLLGAVTWHAARRGPAFLGLLLLILAAAVVSRGVRRFAGPLGDLMEAAGRVAEGDYTARVPERGSREVRRLARAFNEMTDRLRGAEGRRRALLADVAHELRTPLAVIRGNLEGLIDGVYPSDATHLQPLVDEIEVMTRLLDDLRTLSTAQAGVLKLRREPVTPAELVEDVVATFRATADDAGLRPLRRTDDGLLELSLDRVRVEEVFANLISNALRHTPSGGSISVSAASASRGVAFSVTDSGEGIPAEELPHVFERFAKSSASRGSGLGLAIAKSLVEAHGGTIEVESRPGQGTTVRFEFPDHDPRS